MADGSVTPSDKGVEYAYPITGEVLDGPGTWLPAVPFDPQTAKISEAKAEAVIDFAKKVKDWPLLIQAIDTKIDDLVELVRWWDENVREAHRPETVSDLKQLTVETAQNLTKFSKVQLTRIRKRLKDIPTFKSKIGGAAYKAALAEMASGEIVQLSLSNEHYTPARYIEAARDVMGGIDLDPASCQEANEVVQAAEFYTSNDDGLSKPWKGRLWLNPPYGKDPGPGPFVRKACDAYANGTVTDAVLLVNAHCTDTEWFRGLWDGLLCFTDHRINFYGDDTRSGSTHGSVFVYFGDKPDLFIERFSQFGAVVRRAIP